MTFKPVPLARLLSAKWGRGKNSPAVPSCISCRRWIAGMLVVITVYLAVLTAMVIWSNLRLSGAELVTCLRMPIETLRKVPK